MKINSSVATLTLNNGEIVELTLNFLRLMQLKADKKTRTDVEKAMAVLNNPKADILDFGDLFWVAYLCQNTEPKYSHDEFFGAIDFDVEEITSAIETLCTAKKK